MQIDLKLCEIPFNDFANSGEVMTVCLWFIARRKDGANVCYPTKEAAEMAARALFPNESPLERYSRIHFRTFEY